jgi:1-deoxy-D-xylulose-5-phosphate reductoisomerase
MESISLIGSTGSIGTTTLRVIRSNPRAFKVIALSARTNIALIEKQALEFTPKIVCIWDDERAALLKARLKHKRIKVVSGSAGLHEVATLDECHKIVFAMSGIAGLEPLLAAIKKSKLIAIANKELLVIAGPLIKRAALRSGSSIIPIDSEHSAIFQCLQGHELSDVRAIILTASGGPFLSRPKASFGSITPREALAHPRWKMGRKISVDSATMMNKGLEVIEASLLYDVPVSKIEVIVHPESIVHSMVEYQDGSLLAQLSDTDMYFPISFALAFPKRLPYPKKRLDLVRLKALHFEKPDRGKFPSLGLAFKAARRGGTMPTVMNAANEVAVELFLAKKIAFNEMYPCIAKVMSRHCAVLEPDIKAVLASDAWAREEALKICSHR